MTYEVLARKWRPRVFSEVVGQQHVLQVLDKAFENERLHHAYLFTGTRGVGKTTLARIVAKCMNCAEGVSAQPCGRCDYCLGIDDGSFPDLIEIDAASRTRVEEMRELLSDTSYAPTHGRFKIYLIDEVHMLSQSSFNALLKTLEEPPPHVKFLLATTDPQKLPATVLSRCLQFHLKRLTPSQIADQLARILQEESVGFEEAAVAALGRAADGSMRDGLSLLDQAINYCVSELTQAELSQMLGLLPQESFDALVRALATRSPQEVIQAVRHLSETAPSYPDILDELAAVFHACAMSAEGVNATIPEEYADAVNALNAAFTPADIQLGWQMLLGGKQELQFAPDEQTGLEMLLLRVLCFVPDTRQAAAPTPVPAREPAPAPAPAPSTTPVPEPAPVAVVAKQPEESEGPEASEDAVSKWSGEMVDWNALVGQLKLVGLPRMLAKECMLERVEGHELHLVCERDEMPNAGVRRELEVALSTYFDCPLKVLIRLGKVEKETVQQLESRARETQQEEVRQELEEAPVPKALREQLGARQIEIPNGIAPENTSTSE